MEINQNLQNLYAAKQNQQAYKDYKAAAKKGEETEELFAKADINGDGKITKADEKAAKKEISTLTNSKKTPNLFDIDGDEKVNVKDLLALNTLEDIDGDGVLSDAEKAFIEEQEKALIKKLEKQKDKKELDFNDDGTYNLYDVQAFLDTIGDRDIYHSDDATDKYLVKVLEKMNKKYFVSIQDSVDMPLRSKVSKYRTIYDEGIWILESQKEIIQDLMNGNDYIQEYWDERNLSISSKQYNNVLKRLDIDADGLINQKDIDLLDSGIAALTKQLGISSSPNAVEETKTAYEDAKANEAAAKKAYKNATKAEKKALKAEYNLAKAETARAKQEYYSNKKYYDGKFEGEKYVMVGSSSKEGVKKKQVGAPGMAPPPNITLTGVKHQTNPGPVPTVVLNSTTNNEDLTVKEPTIETPPADNNENAQDNENVTVNNNIENIVQEEQAEQKKEYKIPSKIKNLAAKHAPNLSEQEVYEIYSNLRKTIPPFMYNTPTFSNIVKSELIKAEKEKN